MLQKQKIIFSGLNKIANIFILLFFCIIFSQIINSEARASAPQEKEVFFVDNSYDSSDRQEINATLKKISLNGYFYVEDEYYGSLSKNLQDEFDDNLINLSTDFDIIIYPRMRNTFGTEWSPGIDNDSRIIILLTQTKENVGGYFNPSDEYLKEEIVNGKSNEREMLYLNATFLGNKRIKSFLAHEFQHMITWYNKTKLQNITEDIWLNETRSEFASTAIGYDDNYKQSNLKARIENFQIDPVDSLTEWQNKIYDYSSVNLFSQYLADRFGKIIFKEMISNNEVGIKSINKALDSVGYGNISFEDVFIDWTIANYLNDKISLSTDIYSYKNENISYTNFHVPINNNFIVLNNEAKNVSGSIKDWSSEYYNFLIGDSDEEKLTLIKISFNGQNSGKFSVPYVVIFQDDTKEVKYLDIDNAQDALLSISNTEKHVQSVSIIPISHNKSFGTGSNVESFSFSLKIENITMNKYDNNSLLKVENEQKVYLIENGQKRWITSAAVFVAHNFNWDNIIIVSESELKLYQEGENVVADFELKSDGTLLKGYGPQVYLIENGQKRWITSAAVFVAHNFNWDNIIIVSESELKLYQEGENVVADFELKSDGTLLKGYGPQVYLIENGQKRWITSAATFVSNGYNWDEILTVNESELSQYLKGDNI
ncbi:hypothetical protein K0B03_02760 [Patescibacteria group bacterium]|nr:hypothetical protein [Patescibacteria group bacterium]